MDTTDTPSFLLNLVMSLALILALTYAVAAFGPPPTDEVPLSAEYLWPMTD